MSAERRRERKSIKWQNSFNFIRIEVVERVLSVEHVLADIEVSPAINLNNFFERLVSGEFSSFQAVILEEILAHESINTCFSYPDNFLGLYRFGTSYKFRPIFIRQLLYGCYGY